MKRSVFVLAAIAAAAVALPVHADSLSATNWQEKAFNSSGIDSVQPSSTVTQSGSAIVGAVPTNASDWAYAHGGGTGYNAIEHLNAFQGSLVGDLSGKTGISTTFSLEDNNISNGAAFTTSDFGGELDGSNNESEKVLVYLRGSTSDPGGAAYGGLSEWWYSPTAANVTSLTNGGQATLTADLSNLAGWSDIGGLAANSSLAETTAFEAMLQNVTQAGLSFGSGNYYSDGFGFNSSVGGTGSATVYSFTESSPVPLPASALSGLVLLGGLGLFGVVKRHRKQMA